ncbi:hypothetical protein FIBSPDRAFT_10336 [Athelia psychrophila]|uniref:Uncharacterized protein n=1 Tax=Athelia psychrophila TaxID=1759441 RepID=A0A166X7L7_9AGAM|nr:hypothetical protein FIBSPDRAFT_10336 [Fibularhizoctonia sp. CBS 109695]
MSSPWRVGASDRLHMFCVSVLGCYKYNALDCNWSRRLLPAKSHPRFKVLPHGRPATGNKPKPLPPRLCPESATSRRCAILQDPPGRWDVYNRKWAPDKETACIMQ